MFYSIYGKEVLKGMYILRYLSLSNVKEKVIPKVFCLFKNGQKKCPKMKIPK
jgi:hypothetical protein